MLQCKVYSQLQNVEEIKISITLVVGVAGFSDCMLSQLDAHAYQGESRASYFVDSSEVILKITVHTI